MPYPAQVNREQIIDQARNLIESDGLERLTLQYLAVALGVQAPSLYRYVGSKNELLRYVNEGTARRLVEAITEAVKLGDDPRARVFEMARAYRAFAHRYPATYSLAFSAGHPEARPAPELLEALALPVQALMADLTGEADSLAALRGLWAMIHGFVTLELNQLFQRGGDLNEHFERAVTAFIKGW